MTKLLTLKHWQLFFLICICADWTYPSPLGEIINSIAILTFSLWIYSIGIFGQKKITGMGLKSDNTGLFKVNVIIVATFLLAGRFFWPQEMSMTGKIQLADVSLLVIGLYLLFAIVQTIVFACKTIAKLECQREILFGDYFPNLLLMFFFFIGIWILQPKVNKFSTI